MITSRRYDIILFGATGFTGRFVAEHLASLANAPIWAIAGRDFDKLDALRRDLGRPELPIVLAEANNEDQVRALAESTRTVLTTAGPFNRHGTELLAACARAGTDYADITGDPLWSREMIDRWDGPAKASGARLLLSAGYDSIPSELGVRVLQQEALRRWGSTLKHIHGRVRVFDIEFSGGSFASARARQDMIDADPSLAALLTNPFALTPGFNGTDQPGIGDVRYDPTLDCWVRPFMMASINTKNVHRSNVLQGLPYGAHFQYDEMQVVGPGDEGKRQAIALNAAGVAVDNIPLPGEGPSRAFCERASFSLLLYGINDAGEMLKLGVTGDRDPGYGATSRMLAETGLLLLDKPELEHFSIKKHHIRSERSNFCTLPG